MMADDRTYPARPIACVGAVVWRGDSVLMVRRGQPPLEGQWSLPGGGQDVGETVAEAAYREVWEETGVAIVPGPVVEVIDFIERDEDGTPRYHYTLIDLVAWWRGGKPAPADDVVEVRWLPLEEVAEAPMWEETRRVILMAAMMREDAPPFELD